MRYNFYVTALTEMLSLAPKSPFILDPRQIEGFEEIWRTANNRNTAYLPAKATIRSEDGRWVEVGMPQRQVAEQPIQGVLDAIRQADNDLKATFGLYDASLGQAGPEQSGKAIVARQKEGEVGTFNFVDNLTRSIRFGGKIILDLIPHVMNEAQVVHIVNPDGSRRLVQVNQPVTNEDGTPVNDKNGVQKIYDLTTGKYDINASVGASYDTKRKEAVASMLAFLQAYPPAAPAMGDLIAGMSDWPEAQVIQQRLRKLMPAQLQSGDSDDQQQQQIPPALKAQMDQMAQQITVLSKELQVRTQQVETKQLDNESKERIAYHGDLTNLAIAEMKTNFQLFETQIMSEIKKLQNMTAMQHDANKMEWQQEQQNQMQAPSPSATPSAQTPQPVAQ